MCGDTLIFPLSTTTKGNTMNTDKAYIKITDNVNDDSIEPSEGELMLDNYSEAEYTNPYGNDDFSDIFGNGDTFEVGTMFDDR